MMRITFGYMEVRSSQVQAVCTYSFSFSQTALYFADFWKYDIANNSWIWISGPGNNDTEYIPITPSYQSSSIPGGLALSIVWNLNDTFFMFGGVGFADKTSLTGALVDYLWSYRSNQWTLLGSNTGTGPGQRVYSAKWLLGDTLYLFGGLSITGSTENFFFMLRNL